VTPFQRLLGVLQKAITVRNSPLLRSDPSKLHKPKTGRASFEWHQPSPWQIESFDSLRQRTSRLR
jgi:hypothetical protein